jgi:signal transduction histidine kinase
VLRNLVSNALKFTPRGGTVTVSAVFVPNKDDFGIDSGRIKPTKTNNFMKRFTESLRVTITDDLQDLEVGPKPENGISNNHIDESFNSSKVKDENETDYGKFLIVVRDSGVGMSEANQKRLFHEVVQFNPEVSP